MERRIWLRRKYASSRVAGLADFVLGPGRTTVTSLPDAALTPYALSRDGECLWLARTDEPLTAGSGAFLYAQQYRRARSLLGVQTADLGNLAQPAAPIVVCGMGRCGSTLLYRALNRFDALTSWSEPDVFTELVPLARELPAARVVALAQACIATLPAENRRLAIKTRGVVSRILPLLHQAWPDARFVYLHREPIPWIRSNLRMIRMPGVPDWLTSRMVSYGYGRYQTELADGSLRGCGLAAALAHLWLAYEEDCRTAVAAGVPLLRLAYEELAAEPEAALRAVAAHCDLSEAAIAAALPVFAADSQADSHLSRDRLRNRTELTAAERRQAEQILASV